MTVRIAAGDAADLTLGTSWTLTVVADDEPAVTVTLPDASTDTATVELLSGCTWLATYVTTAAGRHTAEVDAGASGIAYASAYVTAVAGAAAMPTIEDLDAYLGAHSFADEILTEVLDAEAAAQRKACRVPAAYSADLREALLRRCARNLAMRRVPLSVLQGDADAGTTNAYPGRDPEVRRLEGPYRRLKVG